MTNTLIAEHLAEVNLRRWETSTNTMQETCWLPSIILHSTNYVQLGQQLTVSQVQKPILQELEVGSEKCGSTNISWYSFGPMGESFCS